METTLKAEIGGKTLSIQTGKVAKQASGSVVVRCGDTIVLVTTVSAHKERPSSFLPLSVEYQDVKGNAEDTLQEIANEARQKWQIEKIAISHRVGKLKVGEINLVVAIASAHRGEGFAACQYAIDQFKQRLPTKKVETYLTQT